MLVAPAVYNEGTIYIRNLVHLISQSGPESTIIRHSGDSDEVIFVNFTVDFGEGSIIGFSIEGGEGGITIYDSAMLVMNNIIQDNWSTSGGGGIMVWNDHHSMIINNLIISNGGVAGGGICVVYSSPVIMNNTIVHNTASNSGAAIYVSNSSTPSIRYNLAYYNDAPSPGCGGIECWSEGGTIVFECNDSWNNLPAGSDYCGLVSDRVGVEGNISEDPLFCGEHGSRNFYLQQGSHCAESNVPAFCNNVRIGCYAVSCVTANEESSWGGIKAIIKPAK